MKFLRSILVLALLGCLGCQHTAVIEPVWPGLPFLANPPAGKPTPEARRAALAAQPWSTGERKSPETVADLQIGSAPIRLIEVDTYFDGGSSGFLLEGEKGKFFAFCTSHPHGREKPAFLLGTLHFTEVGSTAAEHGSASFRFFYDLLWSFADDPNNRPSDDVLRRTRETLKISPEEFEKVLKKPAPGA